MSPIGVSAGARPRHDSCPTGQVEMSLLRRRANRALFEVFNHRSAPLRHARASVSLGGDEHGRGPIERRAVSVEPRPVHRGVALSAGPGGVPAAVAKTGLVTDEDLTGAERVSVCYLAPAAADVLILGILCQVMSVVRGDSPLRCESRGRSSSCVVMGQECRAASCKRCIRDVRPSLV